LLGRGRRNSDKYFKEGDFGKKEEGGGKVRAVGAGKEKESLCITGSQSTLIRKEGRLTKGLDVQSGSKTLQRKVLKALVSTSLFIGEKR